MNYSVKAARVKESSTLAISAKAKELKAQGMNVIGFAVGEPDFDTPEHIKQAAIAAINEGFTKYTPSSGTVELRKAIAKKLKDENGLAYDASQIVVSNGAKHSLANVFTAVLNEGDEVILPAPFWLSYAEMVNITGGVPKIVYTDISTGYKVNKQQLESALTSKTKAILINSPNNPTGMVYNRDELQVIADFAVKNDLFIISDEIYEKLIYDKNAKHISIASLGDEAYKRTIVINGFSKTYAMTGWRVGYTASSKELADIMGNVQSHLTSNANSIAQKAATAALLCDQQCVEQMCGEFRKRRDYIYDRMSRFNGVSILKPEGAFYAFADVSELCTTMKNGKSIHDASDFAMELLEQCQVAVVPCADFGFDKHIRLTYAVSMDEIKDGMDRIERFINENYGNA